MNDVARATLAERVWGELAERILTLGDAPDLHVVGVRPGETMTEVLVDAGETLGDEVRPGLAAITTDTAADAPAAVVEAVEACRTAEDRRRVWLCALEPERAPVS